MESTFAIAVGQSAREAFESGLYCAESVVLAMAKARGLDCETLPKAATGFCGGMSRTCGPCGALTGGVMAIGLVLGRNRGADAAQPAYAATQRLIAEFEAQFGSRDCRELLDGCDLGTAEGQATFQARGLRSRCVEYTRRAAEIAATLVEREARY